LRRSGEAAMLKFQSAPFSREPRASAGSTSALARGSRLNRIVIVVAAWLAVASAARADLDAGLKKPYKLDVVLDIAEHRSLTTTFREQVKRQLEDYLQHTYGKLAMVRVLREHPLLDEVRRKGLQQALDGWDGLSDAKTHFVLIDFVNGRYELK